MCVLNIKYVVGFCSFCHALEVALEGGKAAVHLVTYVSKDNETKVM